MEQNSEWLVRRTGTEEEGQHWYIVANTDTGRQLSVRIDNTTYHITPPKLHEELYEARHLEEHRNVTSLRFAAEHIIINTLSQGYVTGNKYAVVYSVQYPSSELWQYLVYFSSIDAYREFERQYEHESGTKASEIKTRAHSATQMGDASDVSIASLHKSSALLYGWISPNGEKFAGSHEDTAMRIVDNDQRLSELYKRWSGDITLFLLVRGWVRVANDAISVVVWNQYTKSSVIEYIGQINPNTNITIERWEIDKGRFVISGNRILFYGTAKEYLENGAYSSMQTQADWTGYLSQQTFDINGFWRYVRPNQVWMFIRNGEGQHFGETVNRFVRITSLDEELGLVHGIYGYNLESVIDGDISTGKPVDDGWHEIKFVQVFKKPQEDNESVS